MMRGFLRSLREAARLAGAAALAFPLVWFPPLAFAGWDTFTVVKKPNGGTVVAPSMRSLLRDAFSRPGAVQTLPGGGVNATAPVALPVGNTSVGATAGQALSRGALLRGAARIATGIGPAGIAVGLALEFARCEADGGLIQCEQGQGETLQQVVRYRWAQNQYASTHEAGAWANCAAAFAGWPYNGCKKVTLVSAQCTPSSASCMWDIEANNGAKLYGRGTYREVVNQLQCPANMIKVAGLCWTEDPSGGLVGPTVATGADDLGNRFLDWRNQPGWPSGASDDKVAEDIANAPDTVDPFKGESFDAPSLSGGPATADGGSKVSTKINADGTKTQTTTTTTHNITYNQNNYNITTTTTTIIQNFDQNDDPLGPPITEEETETPPAGDPNAPGEPVEDLECGLPGYPPCKIDETGTLTSVEPDLTDITARGDALTGAIDELAGRNGPSWTFTFALPSGCSVINAGEFAGVPLTIDVCRFQPDIHAIMSVVWALATVWVVIGMVGRTLHGGG